MTQVQAPVAIGVEIQPKRGSRRLGSVPLHIVLTIIMAIWAIPALGLLIASFRTAAATNRSGWWTAIAPPYEFTFQNYDYVLNRAGFWDSFLNSFLITIPATVLVVLIAAFAAYAFSWMNFPGRNVLFVVVVGLLVVPLQVTLIPVLSFFRDIEIAGNKLNGTILAVWLAHTGYGLPFAVSLIIFQFLWVWNDLLVALVYLGPIPQNHPLSVTLANLTTNFGGNWQFVTAAAFVSMIIPIIVFFSLQRYFVRGITGGAVKG
jgi:alpha-glucoside transport system permease protein